MNTNGDRSSHVETDDPFATKNLQLPPQVLRRMRQPQPAKTKASTARRESKGIEFFQYPAAVRKAVRAVKGPRDTAAVYDVMDAIYETRFLAYDHAPTVKLTNTMLARYGVSRRQKRRALQILEQSGQYAVAYREERENPWVTELWRPIW
jgi:hypothetical protein